MPKKRKKQKPYRKRRWFTATELVEMWDRWQRGESTRSWIEVDRQSTRNWPSMGASGRARIVVSSRALTLAEREEISRGIAARRCRISSG